MQSQHSGKSFHPWGVQTGVCPSWQGKAGPVLTRPLPGMGSSKVAEKRGKMWGLGRASRSGREDPGPGTQHKQVSSRAVCPQTPRAWRQRNKWEGLRRDPIAANVVALELETHVFV